MKSLGTNYNVSVFINSCADDICTCNNEITRILKKIDSLQAISGFERVLHGSAIKKQIAQLRIRIEEEEKRINEYQREMNNYIRYGVECYENGTGEDYEFQIEKITRRLEKIHCAEMIEIGLM